MRRMLNSMVVVVALSFATSPYAADAGSPFVGTWKLNAAKSQLTGDTLKFTALRRGKLRFTTMGQSYTFKVDGKTYYGLLRQKVAWTKVDDRTWRAVWSIKKKQVGTEALEVSPDGKILKDTYRGRKADGTPYEDVAEYQRVAGEGISLVGTWRGTRFDAGGLQSITIASHAHDGITLTMVEFKSSCAARLDGQDYPFKGPTTPPGLTLSFRPVHERELHVLQKQDGIPIFIGSLAVAEDGRTLTWTWKAPSVDEPMTAVFDRQ